MAVQIHCPHCSQALKASKPPRPGTEITCPGCGRSFVAGSPRVPPPPPPPPPRRTADVPASAPPAPWAGRALLIGGGVAAAILVAVFAFALLPRGGGTRGGPDAGDQLTWEKRFRELRAARDNAANGADRQDKEKALKEYFDSTLRKAGSLDGWLVCCEAVERRDVKGLGTPVIEMRASLRDPSEPTYSWNTYPTVYVVDYDPAKGKPTGLGDALKAVKVGSVVRISGPVVGILPGKEGEAMRKWDYTLHAVAATKVEPFDIEKERATQLAMVAGALKDIEKVRSLMGGGYGSTLYDTPNPNNIQAYYMAAEWPEYRKAVKRYNQFKVCPPSWLAKAEEALKAGAGRLSMWRLLDIKAEMATLTPLVKQAEAHRSATAQASTDLDLMRGCWGRFFSEVQPKIGKGGLRKQSPEEEAEMKAEMDADSGAYIPRPPKKPE